MAEIISGIYRITNTVTGDFYIGSSKNIKRRWMSHKWQYTWKQYPNNQMYLDMKRYGLDYFDFQILAEAEPESLKEAEQQFIEKMHPTYNSNRANGWDVERQKEYQKEHQKEYYQQNHKKRKEYQNKYQNQLCIYKNEKLTLNALSMRFKKSGIEHPTKEAKKYLVCQ